jgi:hypothetical protein
MLAESRATDLEPVDRTADRSMLVLQYLMATIAVVAAILLAGVR